MPKNPKGALLKRWNDWSAGIGHLVDDGRTPGMYYAAGLLGLRGELRPAPFFNNVGEPGMGMFYWSTSGSAATIQGATCLRPATAGTAVAIQSTPSSGTQAAGATLTFSHTIDSGDSDLALIVGVVSETQTVPTGVTYSGDAMTKIGEEDLATGQITLWIKLGPAEAGAANVVVTFAGAHNIAGGAVCYKNVAQGGGSASYGTYNDEAIGSGTAMANDFDCYSDGMAVDVCKTVNVTLTAGDDQTEDVNAIQGTNVRIGMSHQAVTGVFLNSGYHFQWFFDEIATSDSTIPFLYYIKSSQDIVGTTAITGLRSFIGKVILSNTNFGDNLTGAHKLEDGFAGGTGQPARHEGVWRIPQGNDRSSRDLTTVGTGAISTDTLSASASSRPEGGDHLANLGSQLVSVVEDGTNTGGVRILKVGGTVQTSGDWGAVFPVVDITERPVGIRSLNRLTFVLNRSGLYSFNNKGGAGMVFEDFRQWSSIFYNLEMSAWKGGLSIPHPSGLLWYTPGELPVDNGVDSNRGLWAMPPSGPTELHQGVYHSTSPIGDYEYAIYQPDPSSTSALLLCGYPVTNDPRDLIWQCLGAVTLNDIETMQNCFVSTLARPLSSTHVTPTCFFGNGENLSYVVLDPRASPFRARADTHRLNIAADAYMSELRFTEPVDLTGVVIHTSSDMASGDEFQVSIIANGTGDDVDVGPPVRGSGTRHVRTIDRHNVTSLVLHVTWVATSTSDRVPPVIQAIELFGKPAVGEAE